MIDKDDITVIDRYVEQGSEGGFLQGAWSRIRAELVAPGDTVIGGPDAPTGLKLTPPDPGEGWELVPESETGKATGMDSCPKYTGLNKIWEIHPANYHVNHYDFWYRRPIVPEKPAAPTPPDPGEGWELVPESETVKTPDMEYRYKNIQPERWIPVDMSISFSHKKCWYCRPTIPAWAKLTAEVCRHVFPLAEVHEWIKTSEWAGLVGHGWFAEPCRPYEGQSLIDMAVSAEYWRRKDAGEK